jgi:hypothetical protein
MFLFFLERVNQSGGANMSPKGCFLSFWKGVGLISHQVSNSSHQYPFVLIQFPKTSHQIRLVPINIPSKSLCSHQIPKKIPSITHESPFVPIKFPSITHQYPFVFIKFPKKSQIPLVPINNSSISFCSHQVPKQFTWNSSCSHQ